MYTNVIIIIFNIIIVAIIIIIIIVFYPDMWRRVKGLKNILGILIIGSILEIVVYSYFNEKPSKFTTTN